MEPDLPLTAADTDAVETRAQPERAPGGVERVNAPAAHGAGYRGDGARVAVVDSGVIPHPDQAPNAAEGVAFVDCEGDCEAPWHDDAGHGTAGASIVGATGEGDATLGVAPTVTLLP